MIRRLLLTVRTVISDEKMVKSLIFSTVFYPLLNFLFGLNAENSMLKELKFIAKSIRSKLALLELFVPKNCNIIHIKILNNILKIFSLFCDH